MPVTIYPTTLKYKLSGGTFQTADIFKGDKGDKGDTYELTAADKTEIAKQVTTSDYVIQVSGTTVTLVGEPNMHYICGEVTSISITPPSTGTIDVMFTSGSTAAILTLPNTVVMPDWWISVETNRTYELIIVNGVYGSIMSWAT